MPGTFDVKRLESGPVRVVCVGGPTGCPCGGTHVRNTSEIGRIVMTKVKKVKQSMRFSYRTE